MNRKMIKPLFGLFFIIFTVFIMNGLNSDILKFNLIVGVLIGYSLVRSEFGFSGGVKRTMIFGDGSLAKAILLLIGIVSVAFAYIHWKYSIDGFVPAYEAKRVIDIIPGTQNVHFINISSLLGAFIFGIGMILAGGCASGSISDCSQGKGRGFIALIFFIIGVVPGHYIYRKVMETNVGKIGTNIYFPDYIGYIGSLILTLILLSMIYVFIKKYEFKRIKENTYYETDIDEDDIYLYLNKDKRTKRELVSDFYGRVFVKEWSFNRTAISLSILSIAILLVNKEAWTVSASFITLNVTIFKGILNFSNGYFNEYLIKANNGILNDIGSVRNIGIFMGGLICSLLTNRFFIDMSFNKKESIYFALGGFLIGLGSRMAQGCNVGAMISSITNFSLSGWLFLFISTIGGILTVKFLQGKISIIPKI